MNVHDLQAPGTDGAALAEPPLAEVDSRLEVNRRLLTETPLTILDRPVASIRRQAREAVIKSAFSYLGDADEPLPHTHGTGLLIAGHQPELFHPGVWLKNFALQALAQRHGLVPLNLIVDNDTSKNTLLRLPVGDHLATVAFDRWQEQVPYEESRVLDEELFAGFADRVAEQVKVWPFRPILGDFWGEVRRQSRRTPLLGERLVSARRTFERAWGCHNLEAPLSRVCRTEAFAWFACHLLQQLLRFHTVHNAGVAAYRARYGMRSRNHPVPELAREGDWLEMPLWCWRAGQTRRQRLFAKQDNAGFKLRSGSESWPELKASADTSELVAQWLNLESHGFKLRTRAVTTTLFARLFLADMFVHGLGGGKYDELTDVIMREFYGIEPPAFLVLTGTLLLPFPTAAGVEERRRRLKWESRDIYWNPQRHLPGSNPEAAALADDKKAWIEQLCPTPQASRQRFEAIRRISAELREFVHPKENQLRVNASEAEAAARREKAQQRRDFAFCLYPEERLRPFLRMFSPGS